MISGWFLHPALLSAGLLAALPIAIHLLHRLRFRRVRWAAMAFLLESQKRNRRRLFLEELLLLALRCVLVAAIAAIVARPLVGEGLGGLLGGGNRIRHVVVFDDSYSMAERSDPSTALARGARAAGELVRTLAQRPGVHLLTVLRGSRPEDAAWLDQPVGPPLAEQLRSEWSELEPSYLAAPPTAALARLVDSLGERADGPVIVHLVSDFRAKDWADDGELAAALRSLADKGARLHLIDAAGSAGKNLTLEQWSARTGAIAAGVPVRFEAVVRNHSGEPARGVAVTPSVDGRPLAVGAIDEIPAGEARSVAFEIELAGPGIHDVSVELPADVLSPDNVRHLSALARDRVGVLIVDGAPDRSAGSFLALALSPGGSVRTGLDPQVRGPEALARGVPSEYSVVLLANVPALDAAAAASLNAFVQRGGGLAVFLGDLVRPETYNATIFGGKDAVFPGELSKVIERPAAPENAVPDLRFEKHPLFRVFEGERNPFLGDVRFEKLYAFEPDSSAEQPAKVIARTREGAPLVLESASGGGRQVAVLSSAGPEWNNWARNPSFVVFLLELHAYLSEPSGERDARLVGEPWRVRAAGVGLGREVVVEPPPLPEKSKFAPALGEFSAPSPPAVPTPRAENGGRVPETVAGSPFPGGVEFVFADTSIPGVFRAMVPNLNGPPEWFAAAFNVDPREGNLARAGFSRIAELLEGVRYDLSMADSFTGAVEPSGVEPRDGFLAGFLALLFLEQVLAYRLSYHDKPSRKGAR